MVFNPANQSLFLVGHDQHEFVAEVSVPTPVNGNNLDDLPTATVLQNFTDASEGLMYEVDAEGFDAVFPNPTRGKFQIRFPAPRQASVEIRCFNVLGEPVSILKRQLSGSHLELATEEAGIVAAGIYFLSCFENGRAMGTLPLAVH